MKKNDKQRSIFPDKLPVFDEKTNVNILNEVENLSSRTNSQELHALTRRDELENTEFQKNDIAYLVKAGYQLPEVKSPEEMLKKSTQPKKEEENSEEKSSYRMVDLISNSYKLPEVDGEDFLK